MKLAWVIRAFSTLFFTATATLAVSLSLRGCQEKCGNVTIPYPFGIGLKCSANSSFTVVCQDSTSPAKPFLSSIKLEIQNISLYGTVIVNLPVSPLNCSNGISTEYLPISLGGSPFTVSAYYNSLVVMGCKNSVWLRANETTFGGCMAVCDDNSTDTSCNGVNCCQIKIPQRLQHLQYTYETFQANNNSSFCGYVFPADKKWLQNVDFRRQKRVLNDPSNTFDRDLGFAPMVLEWELGTRTIFSYSSSCKCYDDAHLGYTRGIYNTIYYRGVDIRKYPADFCIKNPEDYRCQSLINNYEAEYRQLFYYSADDYVSSSSYCFCRPGFEGNPYISGSCVDIDECSDASFNACAGYQNCINLNGTYDCEGKRSSYMRDVNDRSRTIMRISSIVIGSVLGLLILLTAAWKFVKATTQAIKLVKASRTHMFFKRNGGLLLEQQLAAIEDGIEKTRFFSSIELAKATDDYNESRILGRGGEGVVYKGMLADGRTVAVKKFEMVNQRDVEAFINEVVIVAQINHRNVVKLLGCCLESESPLLVYEFIPNGTLFHHIHHPSDDFPLFWEMRVRIAKEVATSLAYLHSAASVPIYHRDIKSTNILLDEKYRAKISDFGTSRSVLIDQTHVTTRVVGTFGYLDPEYFQSSQFTEKSDVYSYGVVLVELLTGERAISAARLEEGRGLAMHLLQSMEENQLWDIVDARVLKEGKREHIEAMAEIARKCLHLNGKGRPTMKEVARQLEGIQIEKEVSDQKDGCSSIEEDESDDFSELDEP